MNWATVHKSQRAAMVAPHGSCVDACVAYDDVAREDLMMGDG